VEIKLNVALLFLVLVLHVFPFTKKSTKASVSQGVLLYNSFLSMT
jgi:hypothetical protein